MDRELAQMVIMTAARSRLELGDLMPMLKTHGDGGKKDEAIKLAIASAVYETGLILDEVFKKHPDLKASFEARRKKYGRTF